MARGRSWYIRAAGMLLIALACAACGSSASDYSAPSVEHPALLPEQQPLEKQVGRMVRTGSDIAGWKIATRGPEKLADQLTHSASATGPGANRFIRQHWQASYHTIFRHGGRIAASDANVFDSPASARKVWRFEQTLKPKGQIVRHLAVPPNAPPGAAFRYQDEDGHSGYLLNWVQGPVVGIVVVLTNRPQSAADTKAAGRLLTAAAAKQADRISKVIEAHAASMAAR
jgi:hypothetical protein